MCGGDDAAHRCGFVQAKQARVRLYAAFRRTAQHLPDRLVAHLAQDVHIAISIPDRAKRAGPPRIMF